MAVVGVISLTIKMNVSIFSVYKNSASFDIAVAPVFFYHDFMMTVRHMCFMIAFYLFSTAALTAQTVTIGGTVKDSYTLLSIDSAIVEISSTDDPGKKYPVVTSPSGNWSYTFQLLNAGATDHLPLTFDLQQNYPNPFNPSTTLPFTLTASGPAEISVHNILGQLLDRRSYDLKAGTYSVRWSGKGAGGTLFYTLRQAGRSITRKMVQMDGGNGDGLSDAAMTGGYASSFRKIQSSDLMIIISKFGYEPDTVIVPFADDPAIARKITTVHRAAFVFDLHNDVSEIMITGYQIGVRNAGHQSDIPRFRDGGVDAQMIVFWPDPNEINIGQYNQVKMMYDTCIAQFGRNSASIAQARTVADIQSVNAAGKIAAVFCVEGGTAIEEDLGKLITLYNLGARYFTITWNNSTSWATSAADAQSATKGLSDFGKQVIRTMDSLGMIIDVSHTGIKTIEDILATTTNPIIASHSGARALRNHTRNLTDDQIKAIAKGGGVIGVVFYTSFISSAPRTSVTVDTVVKHIDYIKDLVGIDHVAIGSDYDGGITTPVGLEDVSKLGNLTMALLRKGYSPADVRKILGGNYLRVFQSVCK
jgi:membrane dipeptidase